MKNDLNLFDFIIKTFDLCYSHKCTLCSCFFRKIKRTNLQLPFMDKACIKQNLFQPTKIKTLKNFSNYFFSNFYFFSKDVKTFKFVEP